MNSLETRRVEPPLISRRSLMRWLGGATSLALVCRRAVPGRWPRREWPTNVAGDESPYFLTRGVVLVLSDLRTLDWPERAKGGADDDRDPHLPARGRRVHAEGRRPGFWESCQRLGIQVEHELHAMSDLLPRSLFDKDPAMFPMNDQGQRVRDAICASTRRRRSEVVAENAINYTKILRAPRTGTSTGSTTASRCAAARSAAS